jgi:hypothetical protein
MTKTTIKLLALAAVATMGVASPAFAGTVINLDATDYTKSAVTQNFAAGDYLVSFVDKGLYEAWAPAAPALGNWEDRYSVTVNGVTTQFNPFSGARFGTTDAAFAAFRNLTSTFSLAQATNVTFSIPDFPTSFGDNAGGVSLNVSAVPEPATWAMMFLGFMGMGVALRRQPKRQGAAVAA